MLVKKQLNLLFYSIKLGLSLKIVKNPDFGIAREVVPGIYMSFFGTQSLMGHGQTDLGGVG